MIRRLVLISVFLSLQFKAFAAPLPLEDVKKVLDDLLLQVESQSVSEAEAIQEHVPQTRSRLNSRQDMHISIGPVQRRLLDITTRTFVEIAHDADDILDLIFLTARRGNVEEFRNLLAEYQAVIPNRSKMIASFEQGPRDHSLLEEAVIGDNPEIFDIVFKLNGYDVNQIVDYEDSGFSSDGLEYEDDDEVNEDGLYHVPSWTHKPNHNADEDNMPLAEKLVRKAQGKNRPLPPSFPAGVELIRSAIFHHSPAILEHLIRAYGLRDDLPNHYQSALHYAVERNCQNVIDVLIKEGGSRVEAKDHYNRTPLDLADQFRLKKIAELLLKNGAKANTKDSEPSELFADPRECKDGASEMLPGIGEGDTKM